MLNVKLLTRKSADISPEISLITNITPSIVLRLFRLGNLDCRNLCVYGGRLNSPKSSTLRKINRVNCFWMDSKRSLCILDIGSQTTEQYSRIGLTNDIYSCFVTAGSENSLDRRLIKANTPRALLMHIFICLLNKSLESKSTPRCKKSFTVSSIWSPRWKELLVPVLREKCICLHFFRFRCIKFTLHQERKLSKSVWRYLVLFLQSVLKNIFTSSA